MKKPLQHQHQKFDPDALDFYVWDHLNVTERLKRLEFNLNKSASSNHLKAYVRDVPLARGYKHERSKRPASFCRIFVNCGADGHVLDNTLTTWFAFGWFRRVSGRRGIKHVLVVTPDGEFTRHYSIHEHSDLEEFEMEMIGIIRVLHTHSFEDIKELYVFMDAWIERAFSRPLLPVSLNASRVERAFATINKEPDSPAIVRMPKSRLTRYRMGRPLVRQGSVRYRGR